MHDVFWSTIQHMEAEHVQHCSQHVHCSSKVHHMQIIHLQIVARQIWQLKDEVQFMGIVQLSPLQC